MDDEINLASVLKEGLTLKFKKLKDEDKFEDWFKDLSASEFNTITQLLNKLDPVDTDLQKEVLSLTSCMEHLPDMDPLDRKCVIYKNQLIREAEQRKKIYDIFHISTMVNKRWKKQGSIPEDERTDYVQVHKDEFFKLFKIIREWIVDVENFVSFRDTTCIPAQDWQDRVAAVEKEYGFFEPAIKKERKPNPYEENVGLAPISFDDDNEQLTEKEEV